jgi:hypothetical protein
MNRMFNRRTFLKTTAASIPLAAIQTLTLRGQLRYGWLGNAGPTREAASFILFVPGKPGLKVVAQDGSPAKPEHLISSVNLPVEADGEQVGDTFRLLAMKKRWSPELPHI